VSLQPVSRIFVVADEPIIALAAILQTNGYSAKFYTSPLQALTAARSGAPDFLLSAVMMPPSMEERNRP
jgi:CheY-like chemotaxis protein